MRPAHALAAVLLLASLHSTGTPAAEVMTTVRVFHLRSGRVSVQEASAAVQPLLSEQGTLTVQPHKLQLVVQDRPEVVARVTALLAELERTSERYQLRIELLEASNSPLPAGQRVEVDRRVSRMFRFSSFRRLGLTEVEGEIGQTAVAHLGPNYRVDLHTSSVAAPADAPWGFAGADQRVHVDRLTLHQTASAPAGGQRQVEVLRTSLMLGVGQRAVLGASGSEGSERALVLIVEAGSAETQPAEGP